mgnify:CR=1 FL=1
MGTFLGVVPSGRAIEELAAFERPAAEGIRWEPAERLHVTLRYTSVVHEELVARLDAVASAVAARASAPEISLGPATEVLGRDGTLVVPARGAEPLALLVDELLAELGLEGDLGPRDHPFYGHLTLARRRRGSVPAELVGRPLQTSFVPEAIHLIVSEPGPDGSVYDHRVRARFSG